MTTRTRVRLAFVGIILLSVAAGIVDYPKGPDIAIGSFKKELKVHLGLDLQGGAQLEYEANLAGIPSEDQVSALEGTRDVIERRVNAFGVSEPLVQTKTIGESRRVIVELPGVTDVNEAIARIGETPLLEFREQIEPPAPEPLTAEEEQQIADSETEAKRTADDVLQRIKAGEDFAALADEFTEDPGNTGSDGSKKGGDLDFQSPDIYAAEFRDALHALQDGQVVDAPVKTEFGYHIIKREETRETTDADKNPVTEIRARHILFGITTESDLRPPQSPSFENTDLSGQHLQRASVVFDPNTGEPQVSLMFNDEGKTLFAEITKRNLNKPVAIFLDGQAISVPTVQQEITTGEAVISGAFTIADAKELASRLNAGALPVPITLVAQQTIGPTLGQASVERSFIAGVIGLLLVSIFMVMYYRFPGLLSVVALLIYSLLTLAIFKLWPVTLTLAGVAGFILSIGMAVDANILIFERMKEELRLGKPIKLAIEQGFSRAWLSIRDSNMSSLITCVILAWFGTSLVKGFAITLAIGIIVSMFSAINVSRTLLRMCAGTWLEKHAFLLGVSVTHNKNPQ